VIQMSDGIWIGNSTDEKQANPNLIRGVLNVAQDLQATCGWKNGIEYMQVGLIDGPGNPPVAYPAAVLALATLLARGSVLVCCHNGGRSLAVVLMYLNIASPRSLDNWISILEERMEINVRLPTINPAHRAAFDNMNWRSLSKLLRGKVK
jgi:hypothetical protein